MGESDNDQDRILLIALGQLGKAVDMMQELLTQLEDQLQSRRSEDRDEIRVGLNPDIPVDRTLH
jgi:hypothetical protein